jgi:hypothetical protein
MRNHSTTVARNLDKQVKKTGDSATRMGTKFGKSVKASRTSVQGLIGSMTSLKAIIVAAFAFRITQKALRFTSSLIKLNNEQEESTTRLAQALAGQGNFTKELTQDLLDQAAAMQNLVNVDNELIESMMALLATYGMTSAEIKEVIGLTIDFSKAKGIELKAAVDLVGKAFVGYTGTLSRYGIMIDKNKSKEEKYAEFLLRLNGYSGTAAALAERYAGKVGILSKKYSDMKKFIGAFLAQGIGQSKLFDMLNNKVSKMSAFLIEYKDQLADATENGVNKLTAGLDMFAKALIRPGTPFKYFSGVLVMVYSIWY